MSGAALDAARGELRRDVVAFVARRVRSREDAEDIAQEVMLRAAQHGGEIVDVRAWVHRVAANAITDHYRRAARRELPVGEAADVPEPAPAETDSIEAAPRRDLAACLPRLVARLPAPYRQAIELTELGGVSQVEAAASVGLSVSGMKARVQRARGQLRDRLLACCDVQLDRRRAVREFEPRGAGCDKCGAGRE